MFGFCSVGRPAASVGADGGRCPRFCAVLAVGSVLAASVVRSPDVVAQLEPTKKPDGRGTPFPFTARPCGRSAASLAADGGLNPRFCRPLPPSAAWTPDVVAQLEPTEKPDGRGTPFPFTAKRLAAQRPASERMPTQIRDLAALCRPTLHPAVCKLYLFLTKKGGSPAKPKT